MRFNPEKSNLFLFADIQELCFNPVFDSEV